MKENKKKHTALDSESACVAGACRYEHHSTKQPGEDHRLSFAGCGFIMRTDIEHKSRQKKQITTMIPSENP